MKATYDSEANALYIRLSDGAIVETEELRPGLIVDFDNDGRIVGFEMLDARMQVPADAPLSAQGPMLGLPLNRTGLAWAEFSWNHLPGEGAFGALRVHTSHANVVGATSLRDG